MAKHIHTEDVDDLLKKHRVISVCRDKSWLNTTYRMEWKTDVIMLDDGSGIALCADDYFLVEPKDFMGGE
jgi:hypothetical protein